MCVAPQRWAETTFQAIGYHLKYISFHCTLVSALQRIGFFMPLPSRTRDAPGSNCPQLAYRSDSRNTKQSRGLGSSVTTIRQLDRGVGRVPSCAKGSHQRAKYRNALQSRSASGRMAIYFIAGLRGRCNAIAVQLLCKDVTPPTPFKVGNHKTNQKR